MNSREKTTSWPSIPAYNEWEGTCTTVHMWTQIVGKIRLELAPWVNHSWGSALYVTPVGLSTSPIPYGIFNFEIRFNFVNHRLEIQTSKGSSRTVGLEPMSVADFYRKTMNALKELDINVTIYEKPVEIEKSIPFPEDTIHNRYDKDAMHRYFQALLLVNKVFQTYRAGFSGKTSPSHFFWGAFDLAVTRFSGRTAPKHQGGAPNCADWVMEEAYSHELASAGFWPGAGYGEAAFYAYAYPEPENYAAASPEPNEAYYHSDLREFILPYTAVQSASDPDLKLKTFLNSAYEKAADLGNWDRSALEFRFPIPGR